MGSPLSPTLAYAFLVYHKKNWLERSPLEYRLLCRLLMAKSQSVRKAGASFHG